MNSHLKCDLQIVDKIKLRDYTTNTLSHVVSELVFNIDTWEGGTLQPDTDTAHYTCASDNNREGPGVNSTTLFRCTNIVAIDKL